MLCHVDHGFIFNFSVGAGGACSHSLKGRTPISGNGAWQIDDISSGRIVTFSYFSPKKAIVQREGGPQISLMMKRGKYPG